MSNSTTPMFSKPKIYQLVWPLIVEQLLNILVGMVDILMVGSIGEAAVSGVSLVDSLNMLLIQFLAALTSGGTVVCAQFIGMKNNRKANEAAGQLVMLTVSSTTVLSVLFLVGGTHLLRVIFGRVEPDVMASAYLYLMITACSFPFLALFNSSAALFRSVGNSRISMNISLLMNGMNIIGNAICIYGFKMGVSGVALPTLISRAAASLILFGLLQKPTNSLRISSRKDFIPNKSIIARILGIGIPSGIENSLFQLGKLMLQSLVSTLGTAAIAGFAVASSLVNFLYLPGNALGMALTSIVGQCVGAKEAEQAKNYTWMFIGLDYLFLVVLSTGLGFGRYSFISLFSLSPDAVEIAAKLVLGHCLAMILWPIAFVTPYALRAGNEARFTMIVSISCVWTFRVALAYFFVQSLGLSIQYVWIAMYIDWVFRFFIYLFRLKGFSQRIQNLHF